VEAAGTWLGVTVEVIISDAVDQVFPLSDGDGQAPTAGEDDGGGEGIREDWSLLRDESTGRR
jgi:hypothetical protein